MIEFPTDMTLDAYRHYVNVYFRMEFSDIPLEDALRRVPASFGPKIERVIGLHHQIERPPQDAAGYVRRVLRGRLKHLIADPN